VTFVPIDKTPMIISCDDKQKIKIWDIRNYKCVQTIDFFGRTYIRGLVNMVEVGKIALLGNRIELLSLESDT
jgi:WD40 repeat protein